MTKDLRSEFEELLRKDIFMDMQLIGGKYCLKVVEPQNVDERTLKEFYIENIPLDSVAFSIDYDHIEEAFKQENWTDKIQYKNFSWLINENHNFAGRKCDFILILRHLGKYFVFICENKSNDLDEDILIPKLENSRLILKYIFDLFKKYHLKEKINPRFEYIVFSKSSKTNRMNDKYSTNQKNLNVKKFFGKNNNTIFFNNLKYNILFKRVQNYMKVDFEIIF